MTRVVNRSCLLLVLFVLCAPFQMASKLVRKHDVVVYGATGFTGRLVAEDIGKSYPTGLKWAIAGRNEAKLLELKSSLGLNANVDVMVADSSDQASIDALAKSTKVVLSTTGPFALKGRY